MKLIDDIKQFHKFLSVQATLIGGVIVAYATANPEQVSSAINAYVSPQNVPLAALGVSILIQLIARAIAQPNLKKGDDDGSK